MNFSKALDKLKQDYKMSRKGWNVDGQWVMLQKPDEHSKMDLPYFYLSNAQGKLVPWVASQTDLLAEDWVVA